MRLLALLPQRIMVPVCMPKQRLGLPSLSLIRFVRELAMLPQKVAVPAHVVLAVLLAEPAVINPHRRRLSALLVVPLERTEEPYCVSHLA
jgi:hypothetical protein